MRPAMGSLGLINLEYTTHLLKEYFPDDKIEKLKIPLTVAATNFTNGKLVYFNKGPLIKAIQASSCIPGIFNCDFIIGSSCNHLRAVEKVSTFKSLVVRSVMMSINKDMEQKAAFCNILIEPKGMGEFSTFDVKKAETIYWLAYEETLKTIKGNEILKTFTEKSA